MAIFAGRMWAWPTRRPMGVVVNCWETFERIGMPEGRYPLALVAIYLSRPQVQLGLRLLRRAGRVEKEREADVPNHLEGRDGRDKEASATARAISIPTPTEITGWPSSICPMRCKARSSTSRANWGYERGIRDDVARRREAQLAAMVERATPTPSGSATTSPNDRAKDAWLQRTVAGSGRHWVACATGCSRWAGRNATNSFDVNAGSGLLTWEAVRRAGGRRWALATDEAAGEALRQQAARPPDVERPVVLVGNATELGYLLALRGESDVRRDRILWAQRVNPV